MPMNEQQGQVVVGALLGSFTNSRVSEEAAGMFLSDLMARCNYEEALATARELRDDPMVRHFPLWSAFSSRYHTRVRRNQEAQLSERALALESTLDPELAKARITEVREALASTKSLPARKDVD